MSELATVADPGHEMAGLAKPAEAPRLLRRLVKQPIAVVCLTYLLIIVAVAVIAPILLPGVAYEHSGNLSAARQGPSGSHWLGTDALGRDILQRLLVGSRVAIVGVVEAVGIVLAVGVPLGLAAGYFGGWLDRIVGWVADLMFSMPNIIIILVVLAVFPQSVTAAMVTLGVLAAPGLMRVVRSATLPVREELYIAAARVAGLPRPYIMARHILPRVAGPIIVQASLLAAAALLVQSGLGFLNLIVRAPAPSWGGMVADGVRQIIQQPWLIWPPGLAIALTILALGLLGDAVRDATTQGWSSGAKAHAPANRGRRVPTADAPAEDALLSIERLNVYLVSDSSATTDAVLEDVSLIVRAGETVGLVGESGCGKTMTAMSVLGLLPAAAHIKTGHIWFDGTDLAVLSEQGLRSVRGKQIGLVSQEPMISLNPAFRIGWQLSEAVRRHHHGVSRREARDRAVDLLRSVHLPDPEAVARRYPHELSGGIAQRVVIARALAGEPKLLIADEPTTALDVTVQAEILDLLREVQQQRQMAVLLVTHNWGVVADICDRAVVMYAGHVVEQAQVAALFERPQHPYTQALLAANPQNVTGARALLPVIPGTVPGPGHWPSGCHFAARCGFVTDECRHERIPIETTETGRATRCIHSDRVSTASSEVTTT